MNGLFIPNDIATFILAVFGGLIYLSLWGAALEDDELGGRFGDVWIGLHLLLVVVGLPVWAAVSLIWGGA